MFKTPLLVAVAAVVTAMVVTLTASPATKNTPVMRATYQGRTAQTWARAAHGWQATAQRRAEARDWLQARLATRVRELLALHRRFKAEPDRPPHYDQWMCIHGYEGAWNDPNAPYYGGLQFAHSTWERNGGHRYAPEADQATPLQQMWIAENAWRESGGSFSQWPQTARWCGLL